MVEIEIEARNRKEWKAMEEIQEVNSADRIDQLNDLRFKMQSRIVRKFRKMKLRECGRKCRKKKSTSNMETLLARLELARLGYMGISG